MVELLSVVHKCFESLVSCPDIGLGSYLEGSVHGNYRNAHVNGINVQVRDISCDSSAAAIIYLSEFACLPDNAVGVQKPADLTYELSGSVGGSALSTGAGVLGNANTAVQQSAVALLKYVGESRVKRRVYICGKAA